MLSASTAAAAVLVDCACVREIGARACSLFALCGSNLVVVIVRSVQQFCWCMFMFWFVSHAKRAFGSDPPPPLDSKPLAVPPCKPCPVDPHTSDWRRGALNAIRTCPQQTLHIFGGVRTSASSSAVWSPQKRWSSHQKRHWLASRLQAVWYNTTDFVLN